MKQRIINILIDGDNNFAKPLATMIYSLRKNTPKDYSLVFYYVYYKDNKLDDKSIKKIEKLLFDNDKFISIEIPYSDFVINTDTGRWNKQVLLKILAPYYLPKEVDKIIHIDGDIIINESILEFYNKQIDNYVVYGVNEGFASPSSLKEKYGIKDGLYICCGCIVMNIALFKRLYPTFDSLEKAIKNIKVKVEDSEQGFINIIFDGYKLAHPNTKYMHFTNYHSSKNLDYTIAVYHYAGPPKPWTYKYDQYKLVRVFWKYGFKVYGIISSICHLFVALFLNIKEVLIKK